MLPIGFTCLSLLLLLQLSASLSEAHDIANRSSGTNVKKDRPRGLEDEENNEARRESSFDPGVLNRFLEEYASKIKRTTERPLFGYGDNNDDDTRSTAHDNQHLDAVAIDSDDDDPRKPANFTHGLREPARYNETMKRHKYYGSSDNSHNTEDRNAGWVTLEAVPWSKSKISKWQPNPSTRVPWPSEAKPSWEKPSYNKPWNGPDYPSRPAAYDNNKPWQNQLTKPHWSDNSPSGTNKPSWYNDRPDQQHDHHPSYIDNDKYNDDNPNQAQKWPPERPIWDRVRPSLDIDSGPSNFPTSHWDNQGPKPSYTHHTESYVNEPTGWHDRNDFSSATIDYNNPNHHHHYSVNNPNDHHHHHNHHNQYDYNSYNGKYRPNDNKNEKNNENGYRERPNFSHYNYPPSNKFNVLTTGSNVNPLYTPSHHPSSGDGQWILLSTNRGYSKSRQRSIKLDAIVNSENESKLSGKKNGQHVVADNEKNVPLVTSKRQVRLTVLPSINGTNTTTSHGGLLEVERSFKTVEQSQREYEQARKNNSTGSNRPLTTKILINKNPTRNNSPMSGAATSSAVLAAVGAGMLPATMAMMIPMMLGKKRKRRSLNDDDRVMLVSLPVDAVLGFQQPRRERIM